MTTAIEQLREFIILEDYAGIRQLGGINVTVQQGFVILNYNSKAEHKPAHEWNIFERICRGLIFREKTGELLANPFPKFFNLGQEIIPPDSDIVAISVKEDGWLGIVFWDAVNAEWRVSTRGRIDSAGARWAQNWLDQRRWLMESADKNNTILVEIISDVTKIIVQYSEELYGLRQIAERVTATGKDKAPWEFTTYLPMSYYSESSESKDIDSFIVMANSLPAWKNEGYVVLYNNGFRIKIKSNEYLKVATAMQSLTIKNYLSVFEQMAMQSKPVDYIYSALDTLRGVNYQVRGALQSSFFDDRNVNDTLNLFFGKVADQLAIIRQDMSLILTTVEETPRSELTKTTLKKKYLPIAFALYESDNQRLMAQLVKLIKQTVATSEGQPNE